MNTVLYLRVPIDGLAEELLASQDVLCPHRVTGIWGSHVHLQTQLITNHQWPITGQKGKISQLDTFQRRIRKTNWPVTRSHKLNTLPLMLTAVKTSNLRNGRVLLNRPGASVRSTTGSRGVRISGSNAGCTMFRGSVKGTGYPLHSPVSPSLPLPCVTVCHHTSTGLYQYFLYQEKDKESHNQ